VLLSSPKIVWSSATSNTDINLYPSVCSHTTWKGNLQRNNDHSQSLSCEYCVDRWGLDVGFGFHFCALCGSEEKE
jgi:hypothetical protein